MAKSVKTLWTRFGDLAHRLSLTHFSLIAVSALRASTRGRQVDARWRIVGFQHIARPSQYGSLNDRKIHLGASLRCSTAFGRHLQHVQLVYGQLEKSRLFSTSLNRAQGCQTEGVKNCHGAKPHDDMTQWFNTPIVFGAHQCRHFDFASTIWPIG
jgi:hypothetical protein